MKNILEGIKVVAFETSVSGPFASVILSDFGADVIKIEMPVKGDIARHWDTAAKGLSGYFVYLNRNKKSVELDAKSKEGKKALLNLIREADVFIENYRPEAIERLGLTYRDLKKLNPRLIYCAISGYGNSGPYKNAPAYDLLIQAEAGLVSVTGYPDKPAKVGVSICDLTTGLYAALAILLALLRRERTGKGTEIEISMFECALSLLVGYPMYYWYKGEKPKRQGMKHALIAPSGPYLTNDGKYVVISVDKDDEWERLCKEVFERPNLATDPRFTSNEKRLKNRDYLEKILEEIFLTGAQESWLQRLKAAKIASGRLNEMDEVVKHPQVLARKFISEVMTEVGPVKFLGNPIRIKGASLLTQPVPRLGQHNRAILRLLKALR